MSDSCNKSHFSAGSSVGSGSSISSSSRRGEECGGARTKKSAKFRHGRPARKQLVSIADIAEDRRWHLLLKSSSEEEGVDSKASANGSSEDVASDAGFEPWVKESDIIAHNYRQQVAAEK